MCYHDLHFDLHFSHEAFINYVTALVNVINKSWPIFQVTITKLNILKLVEQSGDLFIKATSYAH